MQPWPSISTLRAKIWRTRMPGSSTIVGRRHVLTKTESTRRYRTAEPAAADGSILREAALR